MKISSLPLPVRERRPPYGGSQDLDGPARAALLDLIATADPLRVLARYAVLRAALLPRAAAPAVRGHALSAARAYLDAAADGAADGWPEAAALGVVLSASPLGGGRGGGRSIPPGGHAPAQPPPAAVAAALADAAAEAQAALDRHGSTLLRRLARQYGADSAAY